nr:MAG TPA: hypothetical protein [Caudoviricetes sp.]
MNLQSFGYRNSNVSKIKKKISHYGEILIILLFLLTS